MKFLVEFRTIPLCCRHVLGNIYDMLKPVGQLFFTTSGKTPMNELFELLDDRKWIKYNNRNAISQFSINKNPLEEYEIILNSLGYTDFVSGTEKYVGRFSEKMLEGKLSSIFYFS